MAGGRAELGASEKDAKLAQKLGQLQPFVAVFLQECMANLHLLGQPNSFFAAAPALLPRGLRLPRLGLPARLDSRGR